MDSILEPGPTETLGYMCPCSCSIPPTGTQSFLRSGCWEASGKEPEAVMAEPSHEVR